ncbi:hypothetical protein Ccrd_021047 [Cynara cardunculus var. scolymus]|uniref:Uncharacterized protein n=1 Tax=Cynara cardunculus var. scolymus TaxID=59895 RepID=A0A103Y1A9_CYNCS|nr:hypothetical protein Ccrd_021047 [Cynara cardunculus var. scolymus]
MDSVTTSVFIAFRKVLHLTIHVASAPHILQDVGAIPCHSWNRLYGSYTINEGKMLPDIIPPNQMALGSNSDECLGMGSLILKWMLEKVANAHQENIKQRVAVFSASVSMLKI